MFKIVQTQVLILILAAALIFRIINIDSNPPSMYGDELTMALDVNSILYTGFDTTGKFLPLNFIMGGGRPVGYGYFSLPFIAVFGPGALGIRLLSVLSGIGIVLLIYLLGKLLFSKQVGLFAALLVAVSPWDLSLSRGGFETHFALFLALLGVVLFLMAERKPWFYVIGALSFGLSINTYSTYKLSLPLLIPLLMWFANFKEVLLSIKHRFYLIFSVFVLSIFVILLMFQAFFGASETRFLSLNIFAQGEIREQIIQAINEQRNLSSNSKELSKLLHNKFWEYGFLLQKSYLNNFSIDFLFLTGDRNPRHNMASSGSLYLAQIILLLLGFGHLFKKEYTKKIVFLVGWLAVAPVATSLLLETHALRSSFMLPPLTLLSALGLFYIWNLRSILAKGALGIIALGIIIQFIIICENLYFVSPNKYSRFWSYPAKMASQIAIDEKEKYDYIFLSDRIDAIEFAYPVYARVHPLKVLEQNQRQTEINDKLFRKYGNVYLGSIPDSSVGSFLKSVNGSILYIGPESDLKYLQGYEVVEGKDKLKALVIEKLKN